MGNSTHTHPLYCLHPLMRTSKLCSRRKIQHAQGCAKLQLFRVCTFYLIESSAFLLSRSFVLSSISPTSGVWREANK